MSVQQFFLLLVKKLGILNVTVFIFNVKEEGKNGLKFGLEFRLTYLLALLHEI